MLAAALPDRRADPDRRRPAGAGRARPPRHGLPSSALRRSQQREPQGADDAARHRRRGGGPDHREPALPHEDRAGRRRTCCRSVRSCRSGISSSPCRRLCRRAGARCGVRRPGAGCCSPLPACWRASARGRSRHRRPPRPRCRAAPATGSAAAASASAGADAAASAPAKPRAPLPPRDQYSEKGADTCLECHDDVTPGYSGAAIFKGKHSHRQDKRAPFGPGGLQCEACHGPGARHARSKNPDSINSLKASSSQTAQERSQPCLSCHQGGARIFWHASTHERSGLACGDCHRIHQDQDPMLAKTSEAEVCFSCHRQKRGDFQKTSTHPVRFGLMTCSDCHSPHGSTTRRDAEQADPEP